MPYDARGESVCNATSSARRHVSDCMTGYLDPEDKALFQKLDPDLAKTWTDKDILILIGSGGF